MTTTSLLADLPASVLGYSATGDMIGRIERKGNRVAVTLMPQGTGQPKTVWVTDYGAAVRMLRKRGVVEWE